MGEEATGLNLSVHRVRCDALSLDEMFRATQTAVAEAERLRGERGGQGEETDGGAESQLSPSAVQRQLMRRTSDQVIICELTW